MKTIMAGLVAVGLLLGMVAEGLAWERAYVVCVRSYKKNVGRGTGVDSRGRIVDLDVTQDCSECYPEALPMAAGEMWPDTLCRGIFPNSAGYEFRSPEEAKRFYLNYCGKCW